MELQQRYKMVRFFTLPKTFLTGAGIDWPLHDHEKSKEDKEEKEEEKEEEEEEVNVTNKYE